MKECRSVWGNRITVDSEGIFLKEHFTKGEYLFHDIHSVQWREPTWQGRGALIVITGITEKLTKHSFIFKKRDRIKFLELYQLLTEKTEQFRPEREKRQQERQERIKQLDREGTPYCFECLSTDLFPETVHPPRLGSYVRITCLKCGSTFRPRRTL